jgi:hypothetical protein
MSIFEKIILINLVNLITRIICFATLGDKMKKNLEKANFT